MKVNVSNMPMDTVYRFSDDSIVWSKKTTEKEPFQKSNVITEVWRLNAANELLRQARGELVDNPNGNDYDNRFVIHDLDINKDLTFYVTSPFEKATLEYLYVLKEAADKQKQQKK